MNHIFISNPIDGYSYEFGSDIVIISDFISTDITIGYPFNGGDAIIRYSINGGSLTNIVTPSNEISLGALSNGEYSIEFTLHSSESGLPQWSPLIQTTVNFSIGPSGCTDEVACNFDGSAVANDYSCIYPLYIMTVLMFVFQTLTMILFVTRLEILGCQEPSAENYNENRCR